MSNVLPAVAVVEAVVQFVVLSFMVGGGSSTSVF